MINYRGCLIYISAYNKGTYYVNSYSGPEFNTLFEAKTYIDEIVL
jgi:hypothetical protein